MRRRTHRSFSAVLQLLSGPYWNSSELPKGQGKKLSGGRPNARGLTKLPGKLTPLLQFTLPVEAPLVALGQGFQSHDGFGIVGVPALA